MKTWLISKPFNWEYARIISIISIVSSGLCLSTLHSKCSINCTSERLGRFLGGLMDQSRKWHVAVFHNWGLTINQCRWQGLRIQAVWDSICHKSYQWTRSDGKLRWISHLSQQVFGIGSYVKLYGFYSGQVRPRFPQVQACIGGCTFSKPRN